MLNLNVFCLLCRTLISSISRKLWKELSLSDDFIIANWLIQVYFSDIFTSASPLDTPLEQLKKMVRRNGPFPSCFDTFGFFEGLRFMPEFYAYCHEFMAMFRCYLAFKTELSTEIYELACDIYKVKIRITM